MLPPLVSIIVPVYNAVAFLRPCVESILAQSHQNLELILVNDGSKDDSGALCDALAATDPRVRVLHKVNGGAASARNAGLGLARGDFVQFVDCDDTIEPGMTETLLGALGDGGDLAICGYRRVVAQGGLGRSAVYSLGEPLPGLDRAAFLAAWPRLFRAGCLRSPCNKLYRRQVLEAHGIRFPEGVRLGEDFLFNLAFYEVAGRITVIPDILYNYLDRANQSVTAGYYPGFLEDVKRVTARNRAFLEGLGGYQGAQREVSATAFLEKVVHCLASFAVTPEGRSPGALETLVQRVLDDAQVREELPFARAGTRKKALVYGLLRWRLKLPLLVLLRLSAAL